MEFCQSEKVGTLVEVGVICLKEKTWTVQHFSYDRRLNKFSSIYKANSFLPPATKLGQGYVFTRVCDSVGGGWYPSMHCRWYPSMPCSRSRGDGILACLAGFQAHSQGGSWGVWPGRGLQTHTGGVSQHALRQTPPPWWPLLQAVHILLECILVFINNYCPQKKLREGNVFTGVCVQEGEGNIKCIMG